MCTCPHGLVLSQNKRTCIGMSLCVVINHRFTIILCVAQPNSLFGMHFSTFFCYATDPCVPDLCQNGGHCLLSDNSFTCDCQPGYTGPLCATPTNPTCPDDLCNAVNSPSLSVRRFDSGDHVLLESANTSYCRGIHGYCSGALGECSSCLCDSGLSYAPDSGICESFDNGKQ